MSASESTGTVGCKNLRPVKTNITVTFVLLFASSLLAGCATVAPLVIWDVLAPDVDERAASRRSGFTTTAEAMRARGTGIKVGYQASFDEVWAALPGIISASGLKFVSANRRDHVVLARKEMPAFSAGKYVAISVESVDGNMSCVEVAAKKSMETNLFAPDRAKTILKQLDKGFRRTWPKLRTIARPMLWRWCGRLV